MKTFAGNNIKYIESKIVKNIGLLCEEKPYIERHSILALYHSYIYSYINYGNIAWGSTARANLKKIQNQQKHPIQVVCCIVKIDCHILENALRSVKFLIHISSK